MKESKTLVLSYLTALALILLFFCSCGVFKKVQKQEHKQETTADIETVTTETVTERIDTTITLKPAEINTIAPIQQLFDSGVIEAETPELKISATYDPVSRKIKLSGERKAQTIPVQAQRTKVVSKTEKQHTETKSEDSSYSKKVTRFSWLWWLLLIPILLLVAWFNRIRIINWLMGPGFHGGE